MVGPKVSSICISLSITLWLHASEAENLIKLKSSKIPNCFRNCFYHALHFGWHDLTFFLDFSKIIKYDVNARLSILLETGCLAIKKIRFREALHSCNAQFDSFKLIFCFKWEGQNARVNTPLIVANFLLLVWDDGINVKFSN